MANNILTHTVTATAAGPSELLHQLYAATAQMSESEGSRGAYAEHEASTHAGHPSIPTTEIIGYPARQAE